MGSEALRRYLNTRRDPHQVKRLLAEIAALCAEPCLAHRHWTIMEVCGTHTASIHRFGLKKLLPPNLRLVSGPGCPVCVTPTPVLARALTLARQRDVVVASFGDMLRVPLGRDSLLQAKDEGAQVRLVTSPLDALELARQQPRQDVVFVGVGFETTAPLTAVTLQIAAEQGIANFYVLSAHRTMPQAIRALLSGESGIDALLCPGHVAAVTGAEYFDFIAQELAKPAAVAGFEPLDLVEAILALVCQLAAGECRLDNCYSRAVRGQASLHAMQALRDVYEPVDAEWRGLGLIAGSGLALNTRYAAWDAEQRFDLDWPQVSDNPACCCGQVLTAQIEPTACPLFGRTCLPQTPQGACMVSAEGNCAAVYRYQGREN